MRTSSPEDWQIFNAEIAADAAGTGELNIHLFSTGCKKRSRAPNM
jgi:hypothetical protein